MIRRTLTTLILAAGLSLGPAAVTAVTVIPSIAVVAPAGHAAVSAEVDPDPSPSSPVEQAADATAGVVWIFVAIAVLVAAVVAIGLVVVLRRGIRDK